MQGGDLKAFKSASHSLQTNAREPPKKITASSAGSHELEIPLILLYETVRGKSRSSLVRISLCCLLAVGRERKGRGKKWPTAGLETEVHVL